MAVCLGHVTKNFALKIVYNYHQGPLCTHFLALSLLTTLFNLSSLFHHPLEGTEPDSVILHALQRATKLLVQ